jgi:hypothetical protein
MRYHPGEVGWLPLEVVVRSEPPAVAVWLTVYQIGRNDSARSAELSMHRNRVSAEMLYRETDLDWVPTKTVEPTEPE